MEVVRGCRALVRRPRAPAVAIGNFDGVHLGHRRLFEEIRRLAGATLGQSVALTFDPHPVRLLAPHRAPPLICTPARKLELIAAAGVDLCLVEPFDHALAQLDPAAFVERILLGALGVRAVCVGHDFSFGHGRQGNAELLFELGRRHGFEVAVVAPVAEGGVVCSSSRVRRLVGEGRVDEAAPLLGRDHEVEGEVVRGDGRGRTIGVPTANLAPSTELLPAPGVYAGWAELPDGRRHLAAMTHHGLVLVGAPLRLELGVDLRDPRPLVRVEAAQVLEGSGDLGLEELRPPAGLHQLAQRLLLGVETDAVEVGELAQTQAPLAVGAGEVAVLAEDLLGAGVEPQVQDAAVEVRAQFVDLVLALLPARRDGREVALGAGLGNDGGERPLETLGAQEYDRRHAAGW